MISSEKGYVSPEKCSVKTNEKKVEETYCNIVQFFKHFLKFNSPNKVTVILSSPA